MNWTLAINLNRQALLRVLAILFSAARLESGEGASTLPRHVYLNVMRILRPAESALRRLIVAAARDVLVVVSAPRAAPLIGIMRGSGAGRLPCFPLYDRMKRFTLFGEPKRAAGSGPRLSIIGVSEPDFPEEISPSCKDDIDAAALCRRLKMMQRALDDLPGQARRLARRRARDLRRRQAQPLRPTRVTPMRPGWPPGHRARGGRAVDAILAECDTLARRALEPPI